MNAGALNRARFGAGRRRLLTAFVVGLWSASVPAHSGGVSITIELEADSIEQLRAWRRTQGLDPPIAPRTACGRAAGEARPAQRALSPAAEQRRRRTFVLDANGVWQPLVRSEEAGGEVDCVRVPRVR